MSGHICQSRDVSLKEILVVKLFEKNWKFGFSKSSRPFAPIFTKEIQALRECDGSLLHSTAEYVRREIS